ncbi:uncharacterized protein LOC114518835 isoform X2 [Dendronephthya gigantea]|uniref:uncharacterized protein LOC114518835 isoform X2 n=1 Tax=Dendronephthya gigantea TaxID=151771 RepID=UPI0010698619|nr:uncharacterized protein LOC114518835 isoform X2 [Dendronephthya gigantea]
MIIFLVEMDQNLGRNGIHRDVHEIYQQTRPGTATKSSAINSSRNRYRSQQQPGRYLCVDTRKDQVYAPRLGHPNSHHTQDYYSTSTKAQHFSKDVRSNLPTKGIKKIVQPDSLCKFKTTLAVDYVRDILDETSSIYRPTTQKNGLKKKGPLRPLLGTGLHSLQPNVTKCLGIQNDRQKKTVIVDDGLGVRDEVVSPDIIRFSSATKIISPSTLTVDLRKLSLVDQSETASNISVIYGEQQTEDLVKNPKRIIFNRNFESNDDGDDSWTKTTDSENKIFDHHIDDDDQGIDDFFDCNHKIDYNCGTCDIDGILQANDYRDCIHTVVNDDSDSCDDIDDDRTLHNMNCNETHKTDKEIYSFREEEESIPKTISEEKFTKSYAWQINESFDHTISGKNDSKIDRRLEIRNDSFPKLSEVHQGIADDNALEETNTEAAVLTCDKPPTTDQDSEQKTKDHERQNACGKPFLNSGVSTTPSGNQSSPDQDSVQVKDIWKALNDGGFDISREEVSKYKVNTTRPRIKSAPARRMSSQTTNSLFKDVPTRVKSAISRQRTLREKVKTECLEDLSGDDSPSVSGFSQDEPGEGKLKASDDSLRNDQSTLEVVAISKPFTKLIRKKRIPPVPPLNFQINTIPKSGHFFYFAYGLNMNQKRLEIKLKCQTGFRYWGLLFGFRLLFNKKGSAEGGVGFPNIAYEPGFSVEGCVYELSLDYLSLLDTCIGFPKHYSRLIVPVWMCNSLNPVEHGVCQHCVPAVVYIAQDDWIAPDPATLDTSFTLKQCILGTDLLTSNYQHFLDNQRAVADTTLM